MEATNIISAPTGGLPEIYRLVNDQLVLTDDGRRISQSTNFRYLDFLRHQLNKAVYEAEKEQRRLDKGCSAVQRMLSNQADRIIDRYQGDAVTSMLGTVGDNSDYPVFREAERASAVARIRRAERDLVVSQMNQIGGRH